MKKLIYISLVLFLIASCSKQEPLTPENANNALINAVFIDGEVYGDLKIDITDPDKNDDHDNDGITDPDKEDTHDQEDKPKASGKN